jgi:hypothetical protein
VRAYRRGLSTSTPRHLTPATTPMPIPIPIPIPTPASHSLTAALAGGGGWAAKGQTRGYYRGAPLVMRVSSCTHPHTYTPTSTYTQHTTHNTCARTLTHTRTHTHTGPPPDCHARHCALHTQPRRSTWQTHERRLGMPLSACIDGGKAQRSGRCFPPPLPLSHSPHSPYQPRNPRPPPDAPMYPALYVQLLTEKRVEVLRRAHYQALLCRALWDWAVARKGAAAARAVAPGGVPDGIAAAVAAPSPPSPPPASAILGRSAGLDVGKSSPRAHPAGGMGPAAPISPPPAPVWPPSTAGSVPSAASAPPRDTTHSMAPLDWVRLLGVGG